MLPQRQAVLVLSFCSIGPILPSRPTRAICWRAQRQSRMARLRATALAARSVLDGREHDGMIERVGAPIHPRYQETSCRPPGAVTARWIAQMKPHNSRAIAVATIVGRLPLLMSARKRLESRVCAFQAIART